MSKVYIQSKHTGEVRGVSAEEAINLVGTDWSVIEKSSVLRNLPERSVKKETKKPQKNVFRSPDYIEESEKEMRKFIPKFKLGKYKIFLSKPFIR